MRRNPDDEPPFDGRFDAPRRTTRPDGGVDAVDVREYEDSVSVVADIPDVTEDDIDVQCDGRVLAVRSSTPPRPVVLQVDLPTYVDGQSAEVNCNNGVLEVTLDQDYDPANIGFQ